MNPLLDLIAKHESGGDYNVVWGGIRAHHRPPRPLTTMTVAEVLDWQDSIDPHYMSEAAGRYQIMEDTLRRIYWRAGVSKTDKYNEFTQDKLAVYLVRERGFDEWRNGEITTEKFANSLAKEWASLPLVSGPKKGQSYHKSNLNRALTTPRDVLSVLDGMHSPKTPMTGIWAALWRLVKATLKRFK